MEDFYDTFMDTLESLKQGSSDLSTLLSTFNDEGTSNYLIVFMRLLTSLNIKAQHEFYQVQPDLIFHLVCYLIALGLLTIKWFNIMPHLSLFSFCDETLVPVIF